MGQFGFFDAERRLAAITAKGDPLEMIARKHRAKWTVEMWRWANGL
jgi:hypothetical protein